MPGADELKDKGIKLFQQYDYETAAKTFEQAKSAYMDEGDEVMAAEMLVNLGLVHRALDEGQQGLDVMGQALKVFQDHGDAMRIAQTLGNMGSIYAKISDKEQAYNCYRQAADIFEELGEKQMYGQTLLAMGDLQVRDGKIMNGAATYEVGLENLDQLSARQKMIKGLFGIRNRIMGGGASPNVSSGSDDDDD